MKVTCKLTQKSKLKIPAEWLRQVIEEGFDDVPSADGDESTAATITVVGTGGTHIDLSHVKLILVEWKEEHELEG